MNEMQKNIYLFFSDIFVPNLFLFKCVRLSFSYFIKKSEPSLEIIYILAMEFARRKNGK